MYSYSKIRRDIFPDYVWIFFQLLFCHSFLSTTRRFKCHYFRQVKYKFGDIDFKLALINKFCWCSMRKLITKFCITSNNCGFSSPTVRYNVHYIQLNIFKAFNTCREQRQIEYHSEYKVNIFTMLVNLHLNYGVRIPRFPLLMNIFLMIYSTSH